MVVMICTSGGWVRMGGKDVKVNAIRRYLTSRSGIPALYSESGSNLISGPPPYGFMTTTDAVSWRFFQFVKDLPEDSLHAVIRYDSYIDGVDNAIVGMRLSAYAKLLDVHYKSISDRVTTYMEGD